MADLVFTTRGTAEVLAAQEKLAEASGKQKAAARALSEEYRANEAELRKLGRVAQQIYKENETATERYNRQLAESKSALQGNANEAELLKRQTTQLTLEYLRATDGNKQLTASEQHKIDVKRKYQEQLQREIQTLPQITSETGKLLGEYTQAGEALTHIVAKQESAFGDIALKKVAAFGAGLLSVQKVASALAHGIAEATKEIDAAADATFQGQGAIGSLAAASASPEEFQKNLGFARELERRGIVDPHNIGKAADITTGLVRAHISPSERNVLADLADKDFIKETQMEDFGVGARSIQEIFQGKAGSFDKVLYQLLAASKFGKMDPDELATTAQKYGGAAVAAGMPLDQALTIAAVISRTAPNAKTAASRTTKYFEGLAKGESSLTPEQQSLYDQYLPSVTGAAAPPDYASLDPRNAAGQALEAELGAYSDQVSSGYEQRRNLARAAYTARMRDAASRGFLPWVTQGAMEWTVGSLLPYDQQMSLPSSATEETRRQIREYQGGSGLDMTEVANQLQENNRIQQEQLRTQQEMSRKLDDSGIPVGGE